MHPRHVWSVGLVSVATLSALFAARGVARAAEGGSSVCYKEVDLDSGPDGGDAAHVDRNNERVALNVHRQGDLTYPGGYTQTVYAAFGKNIDAEDANDIMAAAQGTIVVTTKGARPETSIMVRIWGWSRSGSGRTAQPRTMTAIRSRRAPHRQSGTARCATKTRS